MSNPFDSSNNFPHYLPQVNAGDKIKSSDINRLSKAIMQNSVNSGVGGIVSRTSTGTSFVVNKKLSKGHPFYTFTDNEKVYMYKGNVWTDAKGEKDAKVVFPTLATSKVPVGDFTSTVAGFTDSVEFPPVVSFSIAGGNKLIWMEFEKKEIQTGETVSANKPELKYSAISNYDNSKKSKCPIAYVSDKGEVYQYTINDIVFTTVGLDSDDSHPFKVTNQDGGAIKIATGIVNSYPQNFLNGLAEIGGYKGVPALGGIPIVNGQNIFTGLPESFGLYLKFERFLDEDEDNYTQYAEVTSEGEGSGGKWFCSIVTEVEEPINFLYGNYNITTNVPPAPTEDKPWKPLGSVPDIVTAGPLVKDGTDGVVQLSITEEVVISQIHFFSYGVQYYLIASLNKVGGIYVIAQNLRSDFFYYPPLDNSCASYYHKIKSFTAGTDLPPSE